MKRFTKVRWNQKDVLIAWVTESGTEEHGHELKSIQAPHADLDAALQRLMDPALRVLELDGEYGDTARVQSVTFTHSEKTGIGGAVVTILKSLDGSPSPAVLNTPHMTEAAAQEGQEKGVMPRAMLAALDDVRFEAEAYLGGKRAPKDQGDLLDDANLAEECPDNG